MRILGVDPALTITGYGIVDFQRSSPQLLEAGIIKTSAKQLLSQRLSKIFRGITDLISETKPDVMVLEKLFAHYHHPTTSYLLGHARGVIYLAAAEAGVPVVEYAATRIKKAIAGNGMASKYQVQRMVANLLNLKKLPEYLDVTDALALAIAHSNIIKFKL
ncbi:MAG: crossover junction endodeoxyribonuclease RuvC [Candidatus Omnitrophota bacterium]